MTEHISTERMHDLVDGLLSAAGEDAVRSHVDGCAACREELAQLSEVVAALQSLPAGASAPDGLWDGIEARISGSAPGSQEDAKVVQFPGAESRRRTFRFTVPQMAAAAVVVSVLSAGTMWMALSSAPAGPGLASSTGGDAVPAAFVGAESDAGYAQAVSELEAIVAGGRDLLAPETVATLDRALATIDEALAEVHEALMEDPNSEVLSRMLVNHQRSRLRLLRQAATAVQART